MGGEDNGFGTSAGHLQDHIVRIGSELLLLQHDLGSSGVVLHQLDGGLGIDIDKQQLIAFGEIPDAYAILGIVLVLAAVTVLNLHKKKA